MLLKKMLDSGSGRAPQLLRCLEPALVEEMNDGIPETVYVFLGARAMLSLESPLGQARKGGGARGPASRHPAGQPAP